MKAENRREAILALLQKSVSPLSAAALAREYGVSRQIVVGDVALLRALGHEISATPRGYVLERDTGMLLRTVATIHSAGDTKTELDIMVDNGCTVKDVIVEHPIYGQLIGSLELKSRYDVNQFLLRSAESEAMPLCSLTDGIHLHTLLCPDEDSYKRVLDELRREGLLFENAD
ncbi:MAG: transcription repressor NadR [Oscillospiraceae bacterium]|nr:transcription repressor NadR [Oscillospiraceae bacterium]